MNLYSKLLVIATSVSFFCEAIAMPPKLAPGGFEIISSDDESEFEIMQGKSDKRSRANTVSNQSQILPQGRSRVVSFSLPQTGEQKLASLGIRQAESFYADNDSSVNSSRNQSMLQSFVIDRFRSRQNTNVVRTEKPLEGWI